MSESKLQEGERLDLELEGLGRITIIYNEDGVSIDMFSEDGGTIVAEDWYTHDDFECPDSEEYDTDEVAAAVEVEDD